MFRLMNAKFFSNEKYQQNLFHTILHHAFSIHATSDICDISTLIYVHQGREFFKSPSHDLNLS